MPPKALHLPAYLPFPCLSREFILWLLISIQTPLQRILQVPTWIWNGGHKEVAIDFPLCHLPPVPSVNITAIYHWIPMDQFKRLIRRPSFLFPSLPLIVPPTVLITRRESSYWRNPRQPQGHPFRDSSLGSCPIEWKLPESFC